MGDAFAGGSIVEIIAVLSFVGIIVAVPELAVLASRMRWNAKIERLTPAAPRPALAKEAAPSSLHKLATHMGDSVSPETSVGGDHCGAVAGSLSTFQPPLRHAVAIPADEGLNLSLL